MHKLCASMTVTVGLLLGTNMISAQALKPAPAAKNSAWVQGKTADGQPDLQGTWTNATLIPLQRPKALGSKEFYTEEERAAMDAKPKKPIGASVEAHYDLSQFGLDRTQGKFAPNLRTSLITGPDGQLPALTPEMAKRVAAARAALKGHEADGPESRNLGERCIVNNAAGPPMMPSGYNNDLEIVQGPGYVAITQEMIHDTRIIPLDGRAHAPAGVVKYRGDSIGRWEGNTLVVDTTNFNGKSLFQASLGDRIPMSAKAHVVERFTRKDADTITYQFTVEDPEAWQKSWSGEIVIGTAPGQIYEYACHEANQSMTNLLSSARNLEKEAAAAKK
jgi:hypothetical protein